MVGNVVYFLMEAVGMAISTDLDKGSGVLALRNVLLKI